MLDPVKRKIIQASRLFGVDPGWMLAIAWVESRLDPKALNQTTGAAGLFQFVPSTAREYNIDPFNVAEACAAATMMVADNIRALEKSGIEATLTSVYLCHQQGYVGYSQIWSAAMGRSALSPRRKANMKANVGRECNLTTSSSGNPYSDQESARCFILYWTGRMGQAQVEARKT